MHASTRNRGTHHIPRHFLPDLSASFIHTASVGKLPDSPTTTSTTKAPWTANITVYILLMRHSKTSRKVAALVYFTVMLFVTANGFVSRQSNHNLYHLPGEVPESVQRSESTDSFKRGLFSDSNAASTTKQTRSEFIRQIFIATSAALIVNTNSPANAAPPFAIMAEEVGYFPVTDERTGQTVMVPAKAKRESTEQSIELAKYLQSSGAKMYGAFWCPHCQRQKELWGKEAWKYIDYVECSPKGYKSKYATCLDQKIDGYPTWKLGNGKYINGEMELIDIAKISGFLNKKKGRNFDASLETGVPPLGGGSCK